MMKVFFSLRILDQANLQWNSEASKALSSYGVWRQPEPIRTLSRDICRLYWILCNIIFCSPSIHLLGYYVFVFDTWSTHVHAWYDIRTHAIKRISRHQTFEFRLKLYSCCYIEYEFINNLCHEVCSSQINAHAHIIIGPLPLDEVTLQIYLLVMIVMQMQARIPVQDMCNCHRRRLYVSKGLSSVYHSINTHHQYAQRSLSQVLSRHVHLNI